LGVRLPLLPLWRHGRVRQGNALLTRRRSHRSQVQILLPPSPPRSSAEQEQWVSAPRAPVRIGPGRLSSRCDVVQTAGRPVVTRKMLVRPQPSQPRTPACALPVGRSPAPCASRRQAPALLGTRRSARSSPPRSSSGSRMPVSHIGDAGSNPARGTFFRHALGRVWDMRPGCLPGEAGSIPVESASRRRSADEHHAPTVAHGGSNPPGETASQG